MEMAGWVALGVGVLLGVLLCGVWLVRNQRARGEREEHAWRAAQAEFLQQHLQQQKLEFQVLAQQILEDKTRALAQGSQTSITTLLQPLRQQIDAFQQRVNQVHDQTQRGQASLSSEIQRVLAAGLRMHDEAQSLARALKGDKKLAGSWGEAQLEQTLQLAGLVRDDHYQVQVSLKDADGARRMPDVLIRLPDGKHMVIDSKVSLVDYDRAMAADDDAARAAYLDAHVKAIRAHVDDLAKKDYSNLVGMKSPGFVLMFLPIEAAWIAAVQHDRALFDAATRRGVVLVAHTTLLPILKTVANLWVLAQGNARAQEIAQQAGDIYKQVAVVAERLQRLGETLKAASNHYNNTVTALAGQQGLTGKVARFRELSTRANRELPEIAPVQTDVDSARLQSVLDESGAAHGAV